MNNKTKIIINFFARKSARGVLLFLAGMFFVLLPITAGTPINTMPVADTETSPQVLGVQSPDIRGQEAVLHSPDLPELTQAMDFTKISAKSFLVYDVAAQTVLAERKNTARLPIASLTKLLTAYAVYQTINLDDLITVQAEDVLRVNPSLNLDVGDEVRAYDLFNAMLIGSANDAARALGNYVQRKYGNSFSAIMNKVALDLGMKDSNFENAMGFDNEQNYSTAEDLKKLVEAVRGKGAFVFTGRQSQYVFTGQKGKTYSVRASNKLISEDSEIYNIKTGYTEQARGAMITRAERDGHSIILIVLGSASREADTELLKEQVFGKYKWKVSGVGS